MQLTLVLVSFTALIGIFARRYLELIHGIQINKLIKRVWRRIMKIPSKHAIIAKKNAEEQDQPAKKTKITKEQLKEKTEGDFEKADQIFNKADYLLSRGEIEEAKKLLVQALSLNISHEGANHKLGTLYIQEGNFSKAEFIYLQLTQLFPQTAKYHSHLGLTHFHQKNLESAKESYHKAIELDESRPGRFISLARIYEDLNDQVYAVKFFQKAREVDPRHIEGLLAFSEYYIRQNQPDVARELLDEVLRISPRNEHATKLLKELV